MGKVTQIQKHHKKPQAHSKREAQEIIHKLAEEDSANIFYTQHVKDQMISRGFTYNDILMILKEGIIRIEPRYNEKKRLWAYRLDSLNFTGSRDAGCVVAIQQKGRLQVVTIMWIDPRKGDKWYD